MLNDSQQKEQGVKTSIDGAYTGIKEQPAGGSNEAQTVSSQTETSQKKAEKTPGKTKVAGILGPEMVQKARALESMAEGRAPEAARDEVLSSEAEAIAKSAIYRAISILKSGQQPGQGIDQAHLFIYVKKALEAVYSTKDSQGNITPIFDKDGKPVFDLSSIDPNTEDGAKKLAEAVDKLFSQNPEQAAVLGFKVLTDLREMISQVFQFEEIKEPEDEKKKKKEKKLPGYAELVNALGLENLVELEPGPNGEVIVVYKFREDLTFEMYERLYEERLQEVIKNKVGFPKFPFVFTGETRGRNILEGENLFKLTRDQFEELQRQAREKGGKKQLGRLKLKTDQNGNILTPSKNLLIFLDLQKLEEFDSSKQDFDEEKSEKATRRIFDVLQNFSYVYSELRVYTGAPEIVLMSDILNKPDLFISGTRINDIDPIIEKVQDETKKRLEQERIKKDSEGWRKRINARIEEVKGTGDKEKSKEEETKKQKKETALSLVKELIGLNEELQSAERLSLEELKDLLSNLPDNIRQLLGGDNAGENLLRIISGESIVSVCGEQALKQFIGTDDNAGLRAEIKSTSDKIKEKERELKDARETTTESTDSQGKKTKTTTGGSQEERQLIQEEIRELKAELKHLEEVIKGGGKLKEYVLAQIGIDPKNLEAYPHVSLYLQKLGSYRSKNAELDVLLGVLGISKEKQENNQTRSKTLGELRDELKQEVVSQETELLQLLALEEMFKPENGTEESDVLGAIYSRLEKAKKTGFEFPKYESDIWKRAEIQGARDTTQEEARVLYILFGERYLEPRANGISIDTIKTIYELIKNKSITNSDSLRALLDGWEETLLKIAKPGANQQQTQRPKQPSGGGAGGRRI